MNKKVHFLRKCSNVPNVPMFLAKRNEKLFLKVGTLGTFGTRRRFLPVSLYRGVLKYVFQLACNFWNTWNTIIPPMYGQKGGIV